MCAPMPIQGTNIGAQILVLSTSVGSPLLVQGTVLPPVTSAPMLVQVLQFPPVASAPILIQGRSGAPVPIQGTGLPPMAGAPMLSQGTPFPGAYMASPSRPMFMPNFLPGTQVAPPTTLSERELLAMQRQDLEARELEVQGKTQALTLQHL